MMGSNKRHEKTTNNDGRRGMSYIFTNVLAIRHYIKTKRKDCILFPHMWAIKKQKPNRDASNYVVRQ